MDILIKGMEMPNKCEFVYICADGTAFKGVIGLRERQQIAHAIQVPDHGRLIEADVIMTKLNETSKRVFGNDGIPECSALSIVADYIETAPTIIPADKEDS